MSTRIIRYLGGYIRIRVSGNKVEQFLNICSKNKIRLWNLISDNQSYELNITINDFKKIKPFVRKTKIKIVIVDRYGFPFFLNKFQKRKLFIYGFFVCILLIYVLSGYIWNIKLSGNSTYTNEAILKHLSSMQVEKGMKRSDIDCIQIVNELRENFNNIIWASASIDGSNLIVRIKENENTGILNNSDQISFENTYDIKADGNYVISKIIVRKGIPLVKKGDVVKSGDTLVSGKIPIYNDAKEIVGYHYCRSDADIVGSKRIYYENNLSIVCDKKLYSNISKQEYFLTFGKYRFSFGSRKHNYNKFIYLSKQNKFLTFTYGICKIYPYETQKKQYTKNEINKILSKEFNYYCNELRKKGVEILKNDVKIYTWSDKASACGYISIEKNVGLKTLSEQIETGDILNGNDGNNN